VALELGLRLGRRAPIALVPSSQSCVVVMIAWAMETVVGLENVDEAARHHQSEALRQLALMPSKR